MFDSLLSLVILRGFSTRKSALIAVDDDQGDVSCFHWRPWENVLTLVKSQEMINFKNKVEWTGKVE